MAMKQLQASHEKDLAAKGFSPEQIGEVDEACAKAAAKSLNWQAILDALMKYGPAILTFIVSLFKNPPTP